MAHIKLRDTNGKFHDFPNAQYVRIPTADGGYVTAKIIEGNDCHLDITDPSANVDVSGYGSVTAAYPKLTDEVDLIAGCLETIIEVYTEE